MEAIILAGGFGTRLAGRLEGIPKPMAPIAGRPFLEILLNQLLRAGCQRALLSVGHLHQVIESHFGNSFHGMRIEYVVEPTPLGTGGAIRAALAHAGNESVLVLNGDTFLDADYRAMMRFHAAQSAPQGAGMTIAIVHQADTTRYGAVVVRNGSIVGFEEKKPPSPASSDSSQTTPAISTNSINSPNWINAGAYVLNPNFEWPAPLPKRFSFETDVMAPHVARLQPAAFEVEGFFLDIGIPEDLDRAQTALADR